MTDQEPNEILPTLPPGYHPQLPRIIADLRKQAEASDDFSAIAVSIAWAADNASLQVPDLEVLLAYLLKVTHYAGWQKGRHEGLRDQNLPDVSAIGLIAADYRSLRAAAAARAECRALRAEVEKARPALGEARIVIWGDGSATARVRAETLGNLDPKSPAGDMLGFLMDKARARQ